MVTKHYIHKLVVAFCFFLFSGLTHARTSTTLDCDTPVIWYQPANDTLCNETNALFSLYAPDGLTFDWQVNRGSGFEDIAGDANYLIVSFFGNSEVYITGVADSMNRFQFRCVILDECSLYDTSDVATLIINSPHVIVQPVYTIVTCVSSDTSFSVTLDSTNGVTYQWQVDTGSGFNNISNGGAYSGVTTNTLNLTGITGSMDQYLYECLLTGACSNTNTSVLAVVSGPPPITNQPTNDTLCGGGYTYFFTGAFGYNLIYDWQVNEGSGFENISGGSIYTISSFGTESYLEIYSAVDSMSGYQYRCIVSGACSFADTSYMATLIINPQPIANAGDDTTIYKGDTIIIGGSPTASGGTSPYTYSWTSTPTGFTSSSANPSVNPDTTTTYNLSVTDNKGCTANSTDIVNATCPSITVTPNPGYVCPPSSSTENCTTLTALNDIPYSYSWWQYNPSINGYIEIWEGSSVTVCPATTTKYFVEGTYEDCSEREYVTVNVYSPTVMKISGPPDVCNTSEDNTYSVSYLSGTVGTGTWSLSAGGTLSSTNPTVITWTDISSYPDGVTLSYTETDDDGCTFTTSYTIYPCCNATACGSPLTLDNPSSSTIASTDVDYCYTITNSGTELDFENVTSGSLVINNTWTIDENTKIIGSNIEFAPGAAIYIEPGFALTLTGNLAFPVSVLTNSCDAMWNGIHIEGNTTSVGELITEGETTIMNADTAVLSDFGGVYDVTYTDFYNDRIGIVVNSSYENPSVITNSRFECSGTGALIAPYASQTTLSGIIINNVDGITIGNTNPEDYNIFSNLNNGISVYNSPGPPPELRRKEYALLPVNINYNSFEDIQNYNNNNISDGDGIYISSPTGPGNRTSGYPGYCDVVQSGMNTSSFNDFYNCYTGVYMNSYGTCSFSDNYMTDAVQGFDIMSLPSANVNIYNNNISQPTDIDFCGTQTPFCVGVQVSDLSYAPSQTTISCNTINVNGGGEGISLTNTSFSSANDNYIKLAAGGTCSRFYSYYPRGIVSVGSGLANSIGDIISFNYIEGTIVDGQLTGDALFGTYAQFNSFIHNITADVNRSIQLNLSCAGTQLWNNHLRKSNIGLYANNADLPLQGSNNYSSGNKWYGPFNAYGADVIGQFLYFNITNSSYPNECTVYPTGAINWQYPYSERTFDSPFTCPVSSGVQEGGTSGGLGTASGHSAMIAVDTTTGIDSTTAIRIINDSLFIDSDYIAPAGEIWNTKRALYNYILRDTAILSLSPVLRLFYDSAQTGAIGQFTSVEDSMLYLMDSASLQLSDSLRIITINNIASANAVLPNTQLYESAEQQVNTVFLETIAQGIDTFSSGQQDSLLYVANLCVNDAGASVYNARSLVRLFNDSISFNDSSLCYYIDTTEDARMKIKTAATKQNYFNIYPNPANDEVTISYQLTGNNGEFYLYDITGRIIKSFDISAQSGQTILSLADIPAGIYIYKLTSGGDSDKLGKLAVLK